MIIELQFRQLYVYTLNVVQHMFEVLDEILHTWRFGKGCIEAGIIYESITH